MKKTACKALLSLLCAVVLLMGALPFSALTVSAEMGCDFPWTKGQTLLEQIIERDGLLDGVWYPWINSGQSGHNLTGNDIMAQYYGEEWARVELDYYGADKVYREIYNLKAMGFNMMAWGGSIYGEGVVYDAYGDVIGIKQDYLDNARRLLDMCREIGMPVMWNIYFHSSSAPHYYGMKGWNHISRMLGDRTVADHYAERFVKPLCEMLAEYPDVVALISIADEPENEINDAEMGNHFGDQVRTMYGVNRDDMIYFMKGINDMAKKILPGVPRTVASNAQNKTIYNDFDLDLMGHNQYQNNVKVYSQDTFFADADMILTEYNVGGDSQADEQGIADMLKQFRDGFIAEGYKGGFQWCYIGTATDSAYHMLNPQSKYNINTTDFKETVALTRYMIDDYRAEYQGKKITFDTPVLYANDGTGLVEWIPSRNAKTATIERSDDGGKTWKTLAKDITPTIKKGKGIYQDDTSKPKSGFCYRVTMSDGKNKATSTPNNLAGADLAHKKTYEAPKIDYATGTDRVSPSVNKKTEPEKARLTAFAVETNRPKNTAANLIKNGSFESTSGAQWNTSAFLQKAKVVTDKTAPDGNKSLYFDTSSSEAGWYKFTVSGLEKNTDYTFSTWIKGDYWGADNAGNASIGVWDPALNGFMVYLEFHRDSARGSRLDQQIYPTAWDNEWHLRAVSFNSGNDTSVTIALYGGGSQMWVDDVALYKSGDGLRYTSANTDAELDYYYSVACATCEPAKSVTQNVRMDDTKNNFWQSGEGWRNGFLSFKDNKNEFGRSLKYTATSAKDGNYYIKWVDVEPNTQYVFSVNLKVLKSGAGKLTLLEDKYYPKPYESMAIEFNQEFFGDGWVQHSIRFNTTGYTRVGIAVCDLGGEALIDNLRLFKVSDAKEVTDPYKDPSGNNVTAPVATVKPSVEGGAQTEDTTTAPEAGETTTVEGDTTVTVADGDTTDTTAPAGDADTPAEDTDVTPEPGVDNGFSWASVIAAGAGVLVIAGGVVLFLILRKKKTTPTE